MNKGQRINHLRINAGLTQEELARKIGTSKQNIYKYEMNIISNIPSDKIEAIARIFNVSPSYIMGWTDEKNILTSVKKSENSLYDKLNKLGKQKADEYITDLLYNPKYTTNDE